ncbi:MAG TPA: cellulase family glycosylhydrolase [Capsulimonadaceae bacterium]|jgi:hypothetical protein
MMQLFRTSLHVAAAMVAGTATLAGSFADTPKPVFAPFVIPWDDSAPGTATDMSFLNAKPAGINGAIVVKDGHFVESKTGARVRFVGTNFTFEANFPPHDEADKVAAHLAKLGINIVRIHHHDQNNRPLWDHSAPGTTKMSPDGLDRLDYLIAALKRNGIYVNLNLHVSRQYSPADGFPESVSHMPEPYDKRIDNIDRHMIDLQKQFAKDYLDRVNPYTKLSYTADPCVAVVEINNENSLVSWAVSDRNKFFQALPEPFHTDVEMKWNSWLAKKYPTHAALLKSWTPTATQTATADALSSKNHWSFEDASKVGAITKLSDGSSSSAPDVLIVSPQKDDQAWHEQAALPNLDLVEGAQYVVSFRAKADKPREISTYAGVGVPDWHHVGLDVRASLGTDWKEFRFIFVPQRTQAGVNRLVFVVGGDTGSVWLSNVKITPGNNASVLPDSQNLDRRSIAIPVDGTVPQIADWVRFLVDAEKAYADDMRAYLRNDLKVKANIIDTQMSYGNSASFLREADSDFADDHAYWQHPRFPHRPWDGADWYVLNTPMVESLAAGDGGEFMKLARNRVAGKPYTISEYNHPAPSDFQCEMFPELATFGAFQDWDMIYSFDYGKYGNEKKNDQIQGFFDNGPNPAKAAFTPAAALLFRTGGFAPAVGVTTLKLAADAPFTGKPMNELWKDVGLDKPDMFASRIQSMVASGAVASTITKSRVGVPGGGSITVTKPPTGAVYVAAGANGVALAGFVGGRTLQAGPLTCAFEPFGNSFAAMTATSVDGKPLSRSGRVLVTVMGKAENSDMVWNDARTSVGRSWGHGPVQAEVIAGKLTLANTRIKHAWALDPTGARKAEVSVTVSEGGAAVTISPEFQTVWYELAE